MEKKLFGKILVIGLISQFIGASVLPSVGGETNQIVKTSDPQAMDCNWEDNFDSYPVGPLDGLGGMSSCLVLVTMIIPPSFVMHGRRVFDVLFFMQLPNQYNLEPRRHKEHKVFSFIYPSCLCGS